MLKKVYHFLDENIEFIFLCFFGAICLLSVLLQIVTRLLSRSLPWTEEVSRYAFIWVTFWGLSYAQHKGNHIRFDLLRAKLSDRGKCLLDILIDIIQIAIFAFVLYLSVPFLASAANRLAPALNITKNIVNVSCPVGLAFCVMRLIQDIIRNGRSLSGKAQAEKGEK